MAITKTELGGSNNFFLRIDTDGESKIMIDMLRKERINFQGSFTDKNETLITINKNDWPRLKKCMDEKSISIIEASCNTSSSKITDFKINCTSKLAIGTEYKLTCRHKGVRVYTDILVTQEMIDCKSINIDEYLKEAMQEYCDSK